MKLLILNIFIIFNIFAADCSDDPFASGCVSSNNNLKNSAILCTNGVVFKSDGTKVEGGVSTSNPSELAGVNLESATSMNRVCRNHGGIAAYMDDGDVLSSVAIGNSTGLMVSSGNYSAASGNISVDAISGIESAPSATTDVGTGVSIDIPDWGGIGGDGWVPDDEPFSMNMTKDQLLAMTDDELADYLTANDYGVCKISLGGPTSACDYYARLTGQTNGYPHGTGCSRSTYSCQPYNCCSSSEKTNAGCLMRIAIQRDNCTTQEYTPTTQSCYETGGPRYCGVYAPRREEFYAMTDLELADYFIDNNLNFNGLRIGLGGSTTACDYYVKFDPPGPTPSSGYPHGTGCPKSTYMCDAYNCCSSNERENAGCILKNALRHGAPYGMPASVAYPYLGASSTCYIDTGVANCGENP